MARKGNKSNNSRKAAEERIQREVESENKFRTKDDEDHVDVVRLDTENEEERYGPAGETRLSFEIVDADNNVEKVMDEIDDFTEDEEVLEDFSERQRMINEGSDVLSEKLEQHHSLSPDLSGDDIDAAWEDSNVSGEESVGGSAPTPDQDLVDELGEAFGIEYEDDEHLHTAEKLEKRDLNRWELGPASIDEIEEQEDELAEEEEDGPPLNLESEVDGELLDDEELEEDLDEKDENLEGDPLAGEFDEDEDDYEEFNLEDEDLDDYLDELDDED